MTENTKLWDNLGRTDPAHTKQFKRGGGFSGTAIKPMWSYRRMTEEFGPCGLGWGVGEPAFQVVPGPEGEVLVYCTASVWYTYAPGERQRTVYGVGGDKVVNKFSSGLKSDDEAFKKAFTDAVTNALKLIGVGADVHMGMFDDNKYVNTMRQEFSDEPANPPRKANGLPEKGWREDGTRTSYWLKNNGSAEELKAQLYEDAVDCHTLAQLESLKTFYRGKAKELKWNRQFLDVLTEEFAAIERSIMNAMDAAELADVPLDKALKHSINDELRVINATAESKFQ
jgi:hypothetical protein